MGLGEKLQFETRRNKTNQIRIRKRELEASNNRSFASEIVSSDYEVTALLPNIVELVDMNTPILTPACKITFCSEEKILGAGSTSFCF